MGGTPIGRSEEEIRVQCQRTRIYLGPAEQGRGGLWTCSRCDDAETYHLADPVGDRWLIEYLNTAVAEVRALVDRNADSQATRVWFGESPETVFEESQDAWHIYLARDANDLQHRFSGAHEAFHRVCSSNRSAGHWADEMLAVHFSLSHLRRTGFTTHAELNEKDLEQRADALPIEDLLKSTSLPLPEGLYGRAYVLGKDLAGAIGRPRLYELVDHYGDHGKPDIDAWLRALPRWHRTRALSILKPD